LIRLASCQRRQNRARISLLYHAWETSRDQSVSPRWRWVSADRHLIRKQICARSLKSLDNTALRWQVRRFRCLLRSASRVAGCSADMNQLDWWVSWNEWCYVKCKFMNRWDDSVANVL
jgi:hypothetical protein